MSVGKSNTGMSFLFVLVLGLIIYALSVTYVNLKKPTNTQDINAPTQPVNTDELDVFGLKLLNVELSTNAIEQNLSDDSPVSASILNKLMELPIYASYSDKTNIRAVINKAKADEVITISEFRAITTAMIDEYERSISPTTKPENLKETVAKL